MRSGIPRFNSNENLRAMLLVEGLKTWGFGLKCG